MSKSEWRFLIDENTSRSLKHQLENRGFEAEMVVDALEPGVGDHSAIVPYAVANDLIIVTKNVGDFFEVPYDDHCGIIGIEQTDRTPYQYATAIALLVDDFGARDQFQTSIKLDHYL